MRDQGPGVTRNDRNMSGFGGDNGDFSCRDGVAQSVSEHASVTVGGSKNKTGIFLQRWRGESFWHWQMWRLSWESKHKDGPASIVGMLPSHHKGHIGHRV